MMHKFIKYKIKKSRKNKTYNLDHDIRSLYPFKSTMNVNDFNNRPTLAIWDDLKCDWCGKTGKIVQEGKVKSHVLCECSHEWDIFF